MPLNHLAANRNRARRNAIGCALLFGLCILLIHPVLEMGVNDDPSYVRTALEFARTGHFVYNGWAAPILGWQILWGALFIKIFGFSFTVLRLSILPIAMATVYLFHQILVRFGLNAWNAVVGTLTLGLTPIFIALTTTYMTDIPGLFGILLCLYLCQRAVLATSAQSAIAWLVAAAISNIVTGTVRQTTWLGVLVIVPCTAWLLRRHRGLLAAGISLWLVGAVAIFLCIRWFHQQPYSVPESLHSDSQIHARSFCGALLEVLLSLALFCLPIFIAFLPAVRRLPHRVLIWCGASTAFLVAVFPFLFRHFRSLKTFLLPPYLPYVVTPRGLFRLLGDDAFGLKPEILTSTVRLVLGVLVILAGCSFLLVLATVPRRAKGIPAAGSLSWRELLMLVTPFTLCYLVLLLPRATSWNLYDRYLLPLCASVVIVGLRLYQEKVHERVPAVSVSTLAVFVLWGIAATHDYFSAERAHLAVAQMLERDGIPRTSIQGGFEYDFWTQLAAANHLNNKRVLVPRDAYQAPSTLSARLSPDLSWYTDCVPAIHAKYVIATTPRPNLTPTEFSRVSYRTWLPPFGGTVFVEQFP